MVEPEIQNQKLKCPIIIINGMSLKKPEKDLMRVSKLPVAWVKKKTWNLKVVQNHAYIQMIIINTIYLDHYKNTLDLFNESLITRGRKKRNAN